MTLEWDGTEEAIVDFCAEAVVLATGALPLQPDIPGSQLPFVHQVDAVLTGAASPRQAWAVAGQL